MTGNELYLILLIVCVVLTAFFCSSETAFLSMQRVKPVSLGIQSEHMRSICRMTWIPVWRWGNTVITGMKDGRK